MAISKIEHINRSFGSSWVWNSSLPSHKPLSSFGLPSSYFRNQDIPLNSAHSCITQASSGVFLQKHLYPELQRPEGAMRWRKDWKISSANNLSLCCLRTRRRTGTRRAGWRSSVGRSKYKPNALLQAEQLLIICAKAHPHPFMLMKGFSLGCEGSGDTHFLWLLLYALLRLPLRYSPLWKHVWTL